MKRIEIGARKEAMTASSCNREIEDRRQSSRHGETWYLREAANERNDERMREAGKYIRLVTCNRSARHRLMQLLRDDWLAFW